MRPGVEHPPPARPSQRALRPCCVGSRSGIRFISKSPFDLETAGPGPDQRAEMFAWPVHLHPRQPGGPSSSRVRVESPGATGPIRACRACWTRHEHHIQSPEEGRGLSFPGRAAEPAGHGHGIAKPRCSRGREHTSWRFLDTFTEAAGVGRGPGRGASPELTEHVGFQCQQQGCPRHTSTNLISSNSMKTSLSLPT